MRRRELAEREVEAGPYRPYREVLAESLRRAAGEVGWELDAAELEGFAQSVGGWPAFEETQGALARLGTRYRLAILSNVETAVLRESVCGLGVEFDALVTAEEVRSYKPGRAHFEEGLRRLGLAKTQVLHVAQSHYHDVGPALEMGWRVAWVDRLGEAPCAAERGWSEPDLVVEDLRALLRALGA